jgi:UDP-N-acetylglucosamine--N-acetylmuramyl-(pentapeptide) pyrophosphoryl-undecaprenol N-acetylglucosamine transferase
VREEVVKLEGKRDRAIEFFELDPAKKTLLVIGGSLGARTINHSIKNSLQLFADAGIQVVWQTGKGYIDQAQQDLVGFEKSGIKAHQFINKMDYAYAVADIVVSRAGAMSVSELCLVQKPAILVPSPNVAEDHQTKNAMALVNHAAAILVKDVEARETLGDAVLSLLKNEDECAKLRKNIADLAFSNSVDAIASEVLRLAKNNNA